MDQVDRLRTALADRYTVHREIGRGGAATVYLAWDLRHQRNVAVKVLAPELALTVGPERFLQEIQITAGLTHPNILPLHDSGQAGGLVYFVMPYVEGESLRDLLSREGRLPLETVTRMAGEVADALAYAHEKGIVHRDIKPSNLLVSGSHVFVADFGIARALGARETDVKTAKGVSIGTPAYMSPEQASGAETIDGRADLYSLGCVLYEMLSGDPPFIAPTAQAVLRKHLTEAPLPLSLSRPGIPEALDHTVRRCLEKLPADRVQSAQELVKTLRSLDTQSLRASSDGLPSASGTGEGTGRTPTFPSPFLKAVATALASVVLLATFIWVSGTFFGRDLDPNRIMVFPLSAAERPANESAVTGHPGPEAFVGTGEDVATAVGYALEGSQPLVWLEARDWMDPGAPDNPTLLSLEAKRRVAREGRAAFLVDGSVVLLGDSVTVVLRLHDVARGDLLRRSGASAPTEGASIGYLGLRAVKELLPTLLEPGRQADVLALDERDPAAIASWLLGERAFRRSQLSEALGFFERALEQDSALALAAVGAAEVSSRLSHLEDAARFTAAAVRYEELLPLRHQHYITALDFYFAGAADSADARAAAALALKPGWAGAWALRAGINHRLLRHPSQADSLVALGYRRAYELDPGYPDALIYLAEAAAGRGQHRLADSLASAYEAQGADAGFLFRLETELLCSRQGPDGVDWEERIRESPTQVVLAGVQLASVVGRSDCAEGAWKALLSAEGMTVADYWGSFLGLSTLLAEQSRFPELEELLGSDWARTTVSGDRLFLLFPSAGAPLDLQAQAVFESLSAGIENLSNPTRWLYGLWAFHAGNAEESERVARLAGETSAAVPNRRDRLIAEALNAWAILASGDTARATDAFWALTPSGPRNGLLWDPWECLAAERLQLAELLLAAGEYREAIHVAQWIDHPQPIIHHAFRPRSLEIREEAARRLGLDKMAEEFRSRLDALRS